MGLPAGYYPGLFFREGDKMVGLLLALFVAIPLYAGLCALLNIVEGDTWDGEVRHGR
jgi:hypothetical protein